MYTLKKTLLKEMSDEEPIQIPTHQLILSIRENPALYDKSHAQYNNKKLKAALWNKIAEEKVFPKEWPKWNKMERTTAVCYMQKRWGNLRTTFAREVKKTIRRRQEGLTYDDSLISWKYYHTMMFMKDFMTILLEGTPIVFETDFFSQSNNMLDHHSEESPIKLEENDEDFEVQYLEDNSNDSEESSSQNILDPEFIKISNEGELNDTDTEDEVTPIKKAMKVHGGSVKRKASSSNSTTEIFKLLKSNDKDPIDETDTEVEVTPKKKATKHLFQESIHRSTVKNRNRSFDNGDSYKKNKTPECRQSMLPAIPSQDANKLDQDMYFAMSLVPLLKELSQSQKLQAQIDILTVFIKYKNDDN